VEDLAGKASAVTDGTTCWSRGDCTEFSKELDWELQAFGKANTKLEQPVRREAACLRAEKVGAAAHYVGQIVEKVLRDHDYNLRWKEPQRLGLGHH
jgi:hypothetical protein